MARRLFLSSLTPITVLGFSTLNADIYISTLMSMDTGTKGMHKRVKIKDTTKSRYFLV